MCKKRNFIAIISLLAVVIIGSAATMPDEDHTYKNLKVLPKNISHDDLSGVMKSWSTALGVKCNFCHAPKVDNPEKLDFPNDAKPEKEMARSMYKMTMKINKKYFGHEDMEGEKAVLEVNCNTCHRGNANPEK